MNLLLLFLLPMFETILNMDLKKFEDQERSWGPACINLSETELQNNPKFLRNFVFVFGRSRAAPT